MLKRMRKLAFDIEVAASSNTELREQAYAIRGDKFLKASMLTQCNARDAEIQLMIIEFRHELHEFEALSKFKKIVLILLS